jgi:sec-independent protein translocase protein TatA
MLGAMFGLGTGELVVIAVLLIVVFGAKKLPQLGDGLGKAIRGFQKSVSGADEKVAKPIQEAETAPPSAEPK